MNELLLSVGRFTPPPFVPGVWEKSSSLITGLHGAISAYDEDNFIYIYGGRSSSGTENRLYRYDVTERRLAMLSPKGQMPKDIWVGAGAYHDGYLYIHGGESHSIPGTQVQLHRFDPVTEEYIRLADGPERMGHSMVAVGGKLLIFGGVKDLVLQKDVYAYDIQNDDWELVTESLASWLRSTVVDQYDNNKIITTGGCDPLNRGVPYVNQFMNSPYTELEDWFDFPSPRFGHITGVVPQGLLVFGGTSENGERFGLVDRAGGYMELELPEEMDYPFTPVGHMTKVGFVCIGGIKYSGSTETILSQIWTYVI